jgi:hypothetical protein
MNISDVNRQNKYRKSALSNGEILRREGIVVVGHRTMVQPRRTACGTGGAPSRPC